MDEGEGRARREREGGGFERRLRTTNTVEKR